MNFFKSNIDKSLEKILNSFLSNIHFGKLEVQFPLGQKKLFIGVEDGHFASLVPTLDIARKACKLRILVASALTVYGIPNLRFSTGT